MAGCKDTHKAQKRLRCGPWATGPSEAHRTSQAGAPRLGASGDAPGEEGIVTQVKEEHPLPIPYHTLNRWWKHYEVCGEYPFETRRTTKNLKRILKKYKRTDEITEEIVQCIKSIVDEHPEYYLDEIQMAVCVHVKVFLSRTTLWHVLTDMIGYAGML